MAVDPVSFRQYIYSTPAVIAAGGSTSGSVDLGNHTLGALIIPASMVSTSLSFTASVDGQNFYPIKQIDGTSYAITIGATAAWITVHPQDFAGARFIKIISGSAETGGATIQVVSVTAMINPT